MTQFQFTILFQTAAKNGKTITQQSHPVMPQEEVKKSSLVMLIHLITWN